MHIIFFLFWQLKVFDKKKTNFAQWMDGFDSESTS